MNRKLKRYLEEEEKTVAKIAELQEHLKTLRIAKNRKKTQKSSAVSGA